MAEKIEKLIKRINRICCRHYTAEKWLYPWPSILPFYSNMIRRSTFLNNIKLNRQTSFEVSCNCEMLFRFSHLVTGQSLGVQDICAIGGINRRNQFRGPLLLPPTSFFFSSSLPTGASGDDGSVKFNRWRISPKAWRDRNKWKKNGLH